MTDKGLFAQLSLLLLLGCAAPQREHASVEYPSADVDPVLSLRAELSSKETVDGGILLLSVSVPAGLAVSDLRGEFDATPIPLFPVGEGQFEGYVGVPHSYKPGPATVSVHYKHDGAAKVMNLGLIVNAGDYKQEHLTVDGRHVNPPARIMKRIRREQAEVGAIYRRVLAKKLWSGPFVLPIEAPFTSPYGTRRLYNGEPRNAHTGIDLRAAVGTPIFSPAAGEVVLAKDLYFTGGTVILDHGYGVMTLYAHLSKIKVKKGQMVSSRQLLGLAGATGRVSGPHLHWTTIVNKAKVNPLEFMKVVK